MKVIHIADLHLGRKSADDPLGAVRLQALRRAVESAVRLTADAILVAGDVFDSPQMDPSVVRMAARAFDSALDTGGRRMPIIIIPGNHDPTEAVGLWEEFARSLDLETAVQLVLEPTLLDLCDGHMLVEAYPCPTRYSPEAPWAERVSVPETVTDCVHIVLAHGTLLGGPVPEGESDAYPFDMEQVKALAVDYVALGHFHGIYPAWSGGEEIDRAVCYSGTHEPDQFGSDSGWALLVDLQYGRSPKLKRIPVGVSHWRAICIEHPADLDELQRLGEEIEADVDPQRHKVRVRFAGAAILSEADIKRLDDIEASLRALGVRVDRQGELQTYVDVENLDLGSLPSGAVREALISLRSELEATDDTERYSVVRCAIQLGWKQFQDAY